MVNTVPQASPPSIDAGQGRPYLEYIQKTYDRNCESSYTEKIERLDDQFSYAANRDYYWSEPEQSVLYGTPLYKQASHDQKLALNHLYWAFSYTATAAAEVQTAMFNQVTAGVFETLGGYDTLCQELTLETEQEKSHIHAFNRINQATTSNILGPRVFANLLKRRSPSPSPLNPTLYKTLRWVAKTMLKRHRAVYSPYLKALEARSSVIPAPTSGFGYLGQGSMSQSLLRFYIFSWGSSPFLASQYYNVRYMANLLLKNREHRIFRHCRKLQQQQAYIPAPTAVSYYHLLDESFHTTMSQVIGQDFYREFAPPTAYEKWIANLSIYLVQYNALRGLSAGIPGLYLADDQFFMGFLYRLLQQPLFGCSAAEALAWIEQCFCQEHEGLHVAAQWHRRLLQEYRRFFEGFAYLWPVNREMRLMASGGDMAQVVANNRKHWRRFAQGVTSAEMVSSPA